MKITKEIRKITVAAALSQDDLAKQAKVEQVLTRLNSIHGKGTIAGVVWGIPYSGMDHINQGIAVRQMQYGMDARAFSIDGEKVKFLGHREIWSVV